MRGCGPASRPPWPGTAPFCCAEQTGPLISDRSTVLPYILEHELAYLRRNARTRLAITTIRAALIVLCAGLLPQAALALAFLSSIGTGYRWCGSR
ncbi:hypothetical protein ACFVT2_38005 [Streptomyces sp. NPDC058000]|uniref:hypothetical protein n=1 Tax=Streptomyces sp. NPDC058000 TaxID=3346299 RepID=UPI0036E1B496